MDELSLAIVPDYHDFAANLKLRNYVSNMVSYSTENTTSYIHVYFSIWCV